MAASALSMSRAFDARGFMNTRDRLFARSLAALDAPLRRRALIFTVKLLVVILVATVVAMPRGLPPFRALAFFCGWQSVFAGVAALFHRHRLDAGFLTAWDEMAAFFGVAELARVIGVIAG
jgi:hypothetical protein